MLTVHDPWLCLLLPLPWVLRAVLPPVPTQHVSVRVPFGARLAEALEPARNSEENDGRALRLTSLLWILVLVALCRPQWLEPPLSQELPTRDLLLLVDLSSSMLQEDFGDSVPADRLTAVKKVLGEFLEKRQGDRVGLVVFGDAAYLQAPFSTDLELVRDLLEQCQVGMAGPRTALGDAIGLGVNLFDSSDAPAKTIIALTDGNDTASQVPPVEAARVAADRGIHIHTVAMGDPTTVGEDKLDEQALRDVARTAGGTYYFAADRHSLEGIYAELDRIEPRKVKIVSHRPRRELYYVPLALALLLSLSYHALLVGLRRQETTVQPGSQTIQVNPSTGKLELTT